MNPIATWDATRKALSILIVGSRRLLALGWKFGPVGQNLEPVSMLFRAVLREAEAAAEVFQGSYFLRPGAQATEEGGKLYAICLWNSGPRNRTRPWDQLTTGHVW